jgi:hypothetical protein
MRTDSCPAAAVTTPIRTDPPDLVCSITVRMAPDCGGRAPERVPRSQPRGGPGDPSAVPSITTGLGRGRRTPIWQCANIYLSVQEPTISGQSAAAFLAPELVPVDERMRPNEHIPVEVFATPRWCSNGSLLVSFGSHWLDPHDIRTTFHDSRQRGLSGPVRARARAHNHPTRRAQDTTRRYAGVRSAQSPM